MREFVKKTQLSLIIHKVGVGVAYYLYSLTQLHLERAGRNPGHELRGAVLPQRRLALGTVQDVGCCESYHEQLGRT